MEQGIAFDPCSGALREAMYVMDPDLRIRTWTSGAEALLGYTSLEAIGRIAPELLCSEYPNANRDKFLSRIRSLRPARALVLHRCKDGSRKVNMVALTPVRGKGGHAVGQLAIVREVAHGERADALAPGPREVHESVAAALSEGVIVQAEDGAFLACNHAAERILGITRLEMESMSATDTGWRITREDGTPFPHDDYPGRVTLRTGQALQGVIMAVHRPEGPQRWISANSQPVGAPPYAVVTTFTDISEQRHIAEEMRRLEARAEERAKEQDHALLDRLLKNLQDGVVVLDRQLRVTTWTGAAAPVCGWGAEEALGRVVTSDFEMDFPDGDKDDFHQRLREGLPARAMLRLLRQDGGWAELDITADVLRSPAGEVDGYLCICRDVSRLKETVHALKEALDKATYLGGLVPICAWCKKIRNDTGYWQQIEEYLAHHADAHFTHGICPDCVDHEQAE